MHPGYDALLARMRVLVEDPWTRTEYGDTHPQEEQFSPVSPEEILAVERALGFPLPPLLRECYLQLGNGGFGAGHGLIGVQWGTEEGFRDELSSACNPELYLGFRAEPGERWPESLLPAFVRGCGEWDGVDCSDAGGRIVKITSEGRRRRTRVTLRQHLQSWVTAMEKRAKRLA